MSDPSDDDLSVFAGMLPEGAVAMYGLQIVVYLDADGVVYDDFRVVGNGTLRDYLGTLESVKYRALCQQYGVDLEEEQPDE